MRTSSPLLVASVLSLVWTACAMVPPQEPPPPPPSPASGEIAAARALFERNIQAIKDKDRDAYLSCYRSDDALIRTGIDGIKTGYEELAADTSTDPAKWPSRLDAEDMELKWLGPGYVYGVYRYTVVIDGKTTTGISERVFVRRDGRWQIEVTTAFERCPTAG